jgi:predicted transcriptional regulator
MSEKGKDMFKNSKGSFERLNEHNYPTWRDNCSLYLISMKAWKIVTGDELPPVIPENGTAVEVAIAANRLEKYEQRKDDATFIIFNSCGKSVQAHINKTRDPKEMWNILARQMDSVRHVIGRQAIVRSFMSCKPVQGESIDNWFTKLKDISGRLIGTEEEIHENFFKNHIFNNLPSEFAMTAAILQEKSKLNAEEVMTRLLNNERARAMRNESLGETMTASEETIEAHLTTSGQGRGRGSNRGRGRGRGFGRGNATSNRWCTFCCTGTHNTEDCRSKQYGHRKKRQYDETVTGEGTGKQGNNESITCFYCGQKGHYQDNCPVRKLGEQARSNVKKKVKTEEAEDGY